jgi:spore coat protein U-like protein
VGTGNAQTLTVYGQIPAQTTPQPDAYKSTITATVYF